MIPRQLQAHKLVVRHVFIKGTNDKVTVAPRIRARLIHLKTVTFREPRYVQPVSRPTLAKVGTRQQSVYELFIHCILRLPKFSYIVWRGRQTGHVKGNTTQQNRRHCLFPRGDPGINQFLGYKLVNRVQCPSISSPRNLRTFQGLQRPKLFRHRLATQDEKQENNFPKRHGRHCRPPAPASEALLQHPTGQTGS